jgi:hypothetical protein
MQWRVHPAAMPKLKETLIDESGQTLVLASLGITVILGFLALSVDMGLMFCVQRSAQTAADSAAITGALEIRYDDVTTEAKADSARNGYTDGTGGVTVTVNNPPANGPHSGDAAYVEVIVAKTQHTIFMNLFNKGSMVVKARAVATMGTTQNCVYALNPSGTDISISGGADVEMPSCAIYGDSSGSSDLNISGGSTLDAAAIDLVGNYSNSGGSVLTPTPTTGIAPVSDPLAYLSPPTYSPSSCVANPNLSGGVRSTIGPSSGGTVCYNGLSVSGGATATLNPGLYIINGSFSISGGGSVSGSGVTFYLPVGASLSFSGGTVFTFTAPTTGTYNGILFYQSRSNSTAESISGGSSATLQGILYFPDANLNWSGGSRTGVYTSVVAGSLTFSGGTSFQNYAKVNSNTPLAGARIVE